MFFKNIDGNTTCVITLGANEVCDDGANNGYYKSSGAPSYCNSTCSGLIQGGTEYFCGDNVVQHKPEDSCYDSQCKYAIPANYPGAIITDFTASEECDSSDNNNTKHLCDIYLKKQGKATASSYYNSGSISCSACKISASNNPCGYCGDGVYQSGKETCENTAAGIQYKLGSENKTYNKKDNLSQTFNTGEGNYTVPITGIYTITVYGGKGGDGGHGEDGCKSGGNGGKGAPGGIISAQYYLRKGVTLVTYGGTAGEDGGSTSSYTAAGSKGESDGKQGSTGNNNKTNDGGGGGGGGGSSWVRVTSASGQLLLSAYGGGGGGGGEGSGDTWTCLTANSGNNGSAASGVTAGSGGSGGASNGSDGGDGGKGGSDGDGGVNKYYPYNTQTNYKYIGEMDSSSGNDGNGKIEIKLEQYAPCKGDCTFDETSLVAIRTSKTACQGLPANAEWWNNPAEVTQEFKNGSWTPPEQGEHSATNPGSNVCKYKCQSGYNWNGSACVNKRVVACPILTTPTDSNWEWNVVSEIVQSYNGSTWSPADTVYSPAERPDPTTSECRFRCKEGYTYQKDDYTYTQSGTTTTVEGNHCKNERIVNCTGLPAHAHWTSNNGTIKTITQNWTQADPAENGWAPASTGSNNSSTAANQCYFQCNKNYNYNSATNTCVAKTQTVDCTNLPAANAVWWSNGSTTTPQITQTWDENGTGCNGTNCWYPTNVGSNQASGETNQCYFHCKTNYTYSAPGNTCEANTQPANCSSKPGNTSWNDSGYNHNNVAGTFTQTWNGSAWTPASYTSAHSKTAGICKFKCNTNYTWNSTECVADKMGSNCGKKPDNTVWNDNGYYYNGPNTVSGSVSGSGTFERTWNDSVFDPTSYNAVYSPSSAAKCGYKCADSFHTENGGSTCISNTRTTASCSAKPDNSVWNDGGKNGKFTQTWNGSWTPASFTSTYNETAGECRFKCDTNFEWKDSQCKPKTQGPVTCSGNPANSTLWQPPKITQTWTYVNDEWQWYPSTTATYTFIPVSGECHFRCNDGYGWTGSACIPECSTSSGTPCIDSSTGLIWSSKLSSQYNWADAKTQCNSLSEGGYSWRSPTIDELRTLIQGCDSSSGIGGPCKLSDPDCLYWSSSPCGSNANCSCSSGSSKLGDTGEMWSSSAQTDYAGSYAWGVNFSNGSIPDGSQSSKRNVRCVARSSAGAVNPAIVYLKLDEGGTASATVNSGTLGGTYPVSGGSWDASGKHGKAYNFTGNTIIGSAGTFNSSAYYNNFTVMAWVKPNSSISMPSSTSGSGVFTVTSNAERYIFGASHGGEPAENPAGAGVAVGTNGIFVTAHGGGYLPALAYYSTSLSSSQWYHVAVVFENKVPKIYLNGNHVATGATPTKNIFPPSQIGGGSYGNFSGSLDDVIIIGSALTAAEIQAEYNR